MPLSTINNGELGSSVRAKMNALIEQTNESVATLPDLEALVDAATTQAGIATTKAGEASTSADEAAASATAASGSAADALEAVETLADLATLQGMVTDAEAAQAGAEAAETGSENARDAAIAAAASIGVYSDTTIAAAKTAGIAAASEGQSFHATGADVDYIGLYRDVSGVAVELALYPKIEAFARGVANAGANILREATFDSATVGALAAVASPSIATVQPGLPRWSVIKNVAYGLAGLEVVDDEWNALSRTARAVKMHHVRSSSGTVSTDAQFYQLRPIPPHLLGRTDIPVTLKYAYKRQSTAVDVLAMFEGFNAAKASVAFFTATKVSTDVVGDWAIATFTGTITNASVAYVALAPRFLTRLVSNGGSTTDVDEYAWLGPVFGSLWSNTFQDFDKSLEDAVIRSMLAEYPERIGAPYLAGQNLVENGDLSDTEVGQTTAPAGFTVTFGGASAVQATYSIVSMDTPIKGVYRALETDHYYNGTNLTDLQVVQVFDIPEPFHGDTTLKFQCGLHFMRSSPSIDPSVVIRALDAGGSLLATLTPVSRSSDPVASDQWVPQSWEATVTNGSARKIEVRYRTRVNSALGVVSGLKSWQTGFFAGHGRGTDFVVYTPNFDYDARRALAPTTDSLDDRIAALEAEATTGSTADRWLDQWGNAHRIFPTATLDIWGDSQTDAMEEYLISAVSDLAGAGFGIGGETSAQILARMQGYQADVSGLSWDAGTKRLRAARCIPPRVISETYRAIWSAYGAKIAEPAYVEFFNKYGRIGQSADRYAATATVSGDTWTASGHEFANGDVIHFRQASFPGNAYRYKPYYVRDVSGSTFKLSEFDGDSAITFDAFGGSVEWLGDFYFDWSYDGSDNHDVVVRTHCPTDEGVVHICAGTNDIGQELSLADLKANIQAIVAQIKSSRARFIVSGVPGFYDGFSNWVIGGDYHNVMTALHAWLAATYPDNFLDIYAYLLTQGDGGSNDNADIALGYVPRSLRNSATDGHLNATGCGLWADQVAAMMIDKGWITA